MSTTVALLLAALQLLTMVMQTPQAPQSLRDTATRVAYQAIELAQIQSGGTIQIPFGSSAPVQIQVPALPGTPNNSQQTQPTNQNSSMPNLDTQAKNELFADLMNRSQPDPNPANNMQYGEFIFKVYVVTPTGQHLEKGQIGMEAPDNLYGDTEVRQIDTRTNARVNDWYTAFTYHPTTKGEKTLTFKSGNLVKTVQVVVE